MEFSMVREAFLDALAVVAPVECAGCGSPDRAICADCRFALVPSVRIDTRGDRPPFISALVYDDRVRRVILELKEQGRTDAARYLAPALRAAVRIAVAGAVEVTSVPSSRSAYRRRGYDPVRMLLRAARLPSDRSVLTSVRSIRAQKTLHRDDRDANLAGSMRARRPLAGRRFVVVDDVLTTGATLREAIRAIEEGGGSVIAAATVARTPLRSDDSARTGHPPRRAP